MRKRINGRTREGKLHLWVIVSTIRDHCYELFCLDNRGRVTCTIYVKVTTDIHVMFTLCLRVFRNFDVVSKLITSAISAYFELYVGTQITIRFTYLGHRVHRVHIIL